MGKWVGEVDLDAAREERRQQARLNATLMWCAIIALPCYLPFDYWLVPEYWVALCLGRLLAVAGVVVCLWWQHGHPERTEKALLAGALIVELFMSWGASLIDHSHTFFYWNQSMVLAMFVLLPVATVWHWTNMLIHNLFMVVVYGLCFALWSPFSVAELFQYGGAFLLLGILISPLLSQVRHFNFTRAARLRIELYQRNAELTEANELLARQHEELLHWASFDVMTGLCNRRHGMVLLRSALDSCRCMRQPLSVMLIDVDRLKAVNDNLGHAVGDRLICCVATTLGELLHKGEVACRLGGDEFLIVMPGVSEPGARQRAAILVQRLATMRLEEAPDTPVMASVGIATCEPWQDDALDMDALIARADGVMYTNKRHARQRGATKGASRPVITPRGWGFPDK